MVKVNFTKIVHKTGLKDLKFWKYNGKYIIKDSKNYEKLIHIAKTGIFRNFA